MGFRGQLLCEERDSSMASPTCACLCWTIGPTRRDLFRARLVLLCCGRTPAETWNAESPRYLCWIGKNREALRIIERLHRDPDDPENSAAHAEFVQIRAQVEKDKELKSGYIRMFTKPSWRKRSLLALFLM